MCVSVCEDVCVEMCVCVARWENLILILGSHSLFVLYYIEARSLVLSLFGDKCHCVFRVRGCVRVCVWRCVYVCVPLAVAFYKQFSQPGRRSSVLDALCLLMCLASDSTCASVECEASDNVF